MIENVDVIDLFAGTGGFTNIEYMGVITRYTPPYPTSVGCKKMK